MPIHYEVEAFQRTLKDQLLAAECAGEFTHLLAKSVAHVERLEVHAAFAALHDSWHCGLMPTQRVSALRHVSL